jgi:hypothetical protein
MTGLRWEDVRDDWNPEDGTLRDVFVEPVTDDDWKRVRQLVDSKGWSSSYTENGRPAEMPSNVRDIVARRHDMNVLWRIRPVSDISVHCQFWAAEEMEFDFAVTEVTDQDEFDVVCEFVSSIGNALHKPVSVTIESAHDLEIMRFDPGSGEFTRIPPRA